MDGGWDPQVMGPRPRFPLASMAGWMVLHAAGAAALVLLSRAGMASTGPLPAFLLLVGVLGACRSVGHWRSRRVAWDRLDALGSGGNLRPDIVVGSTACLDECILIDSRRRLLVSRATGVMSLSRINHVDVQTLEATPRAAALPSLLLGLWTRDGLRRRTHRIRLWDAEEPSPFWPSALVSSAGDAIWAEWTVKRAIRRPVAADRR